VTSRLRRQVTRALYVTDRAWEQLVGWRRLGIRRRDLVLDLGSGGHPFIRADVLCDKFLFDHSQRQRGESPVVDRPTVVADAGHLPFGDRTFDFSWSSHLLEHLDDPAAYLRELARVSRRGIVIAPSGAWERLYPVAAHRWAVTLASPRLRLSPKPPAPADEPVARLFHEGLERYGLLYFWNYFRDVFEIRHRWSGEIDFEVQEDAASSDGWRPSGIGHGDAPDRGVVDSLGKRRLKILASRAIRRVASAHFGLDLWSMLVCPGCRGELARAPDHADCRGCGRRYQVLECIPILLV